MSYFNYQGKAIFYREAGSGKPLLMLHGDTASSVMFEPLLPLYQEYFRVILLDFLGNGKSERVDSFPAELWISQAWQVITLIEHLRLKEANLLGTSGGAWVAVNAALERPDLMGKVVADSFDGRTLAEDFAENLLKERRFAKGNAQARQFYQWCQGEDWETVVDKNTRALAACAKKRLPLFCRPLETLKVPILFVGSRGDNMCRRDMAEEYAVMKGLVPQGKIQIFENGGHPAVMSRAEEFARTVISFINS